MAKKSVGTVSLVLGVAVLGIVVLLAMMMGAIPSATPSGAGSETIQVSTDNTATLNVNGYDLSADSKTEVYPIYTIVDQDGNIIIDDAVTNSTTVARDLVGNPSAVSIYGTGTTYYCDAIIGQVIDDDPEYSNVDCYTGSAESSMSMTMFTDKGIGLTADDNATNEADYSVSLGSDEIAILYAELQNADSDSRYQLGAVCTFIDGDIDDYEVIDDSQRGNYWVEIPLPKEVKDAVPLLKNDSGTDMAGDWSHCYKPRDSAFITLDEYETIYIKTKVTAGNTNPALNTGDNFGILAVDYSFDGNAEGVVTGGIDDFTVAQDIGNMGVIDEGTELVDAFGLDIVASVEGL